MEARILPEGTRTPTALDDFLFDLNGFLILRNAVDQGLLDELNTAFDNFPDIANGEWWGNAQRYAPDSNVGEFRLQNPVEVGEPFEKLIDHPSWVEYVRHFASDEGSGWTGLFIDECFASIRETGGYAALHSGGYASPTRTQFVVRNGKFRCGQVNIILALTDVGPGDGATMVIPGSHKANFPYPLNGAKHMGELEGAQPVYLNAGDALLFVDSIIHGSDTRTNEGQRRVTIYRYGPRWGQSRYNYAFSQELLDRLTPERRAILQPVAPRRNPELS